jgi:hypothetical protein
MMNCLPVKKVVAGVMAGALVYLVSTQPVNGQVVRRSFQNANGTQGRLMRTNGVRTGPLGGRFRGGGAGVWNPNYGGAGAYGVAGTGPNNNPYYKYGAGAFNKQTGKGAYTSGGQATINGKNYGGEETTQFTQGQGYTRNVETDNHGDYTVTKTKGSAPVVTQTAPPGSGAPNMPSAGSVSNAALNPPAR